MKRCHIVLSLYAITTSARKAKVEVVGREQMGNNTLATSGTRVFPLPAVVILMILYSVYILAVTYDIALLLHISEGCSCTSIENHRYEDSSILRLPSSLLDMGLEWYSFFWHES